MLEAEQHRRPRALRGAYLSRSLSVSERIHALSIPEPNTGCWLWLGSLLHNGYGQIFVAETPNERRAHRIAYEALRGPISDGLQLDHKCRVRSCVNPDHLEPVTPQENTLRGEGPTAINARKERCDAGHPLAGRNLYITTEGARRCRRCHADRENERRRRHFDRSTGTLTPPRERGPRPSFSGEASR